MTFRYAFLLLTGFLLLALRTPASGQTNILFTIDAGKTVALSGLAS
ncbi:MAG TPA: hypothetical protein PKE55_13690 [Kiritimatiellia bacterium]|nr:hypothetical protein [Kiritimatiellia bacterium]